MKIAKTIASIIAGALTLYLFVFAFWALMAVSCLQYVDQHGLSSGECRDNVLTRVVAKIYPISLMAKK